MKDMNNDIWKSYLSFNKNLPIEDTTQPLQSIIGIHLNYISTKHQDILDLGAGDGYAANTLMDKGKNVTAASLNPKEVNYMLSRGINAVEEDMHNLSFEDNSFDCVYMRQTLEHALAPYMVMSEVYRVLKDDGHFILIVPPEIDITNTNGGFIYAHNFSSKHYSVLTEVQLYTLWTKVGFELENMWILQTINGKDQGYLLRRS